MGSIFPWTPSLFQRWFELRREICYWATFCKQLGSIICHLVWHWRKILKLLPCWNCHTMWLPCCKVRITCLPYPVVVRSTINIKSTWHKSGLKIGHYHSISTFSFSGVFNMISFLTRTADTSIVWTTFYVTWSHSQKRKGKILSEINCIWNCDYVCFTRCLLLRFPSYGVKS